MVKNQWHCIATQLQPCRHLRQFCDGVHIAGGASLRGWDAQFGIRHTVAVVDSEQAISVLPCWSAPFSYPPSYSSI
jgi:hypothetical protein